MNGLSAPSVGRANAVYRSDSTCSIGAHNADLASGSPVFPAPAGKKSGFYVDRGDLVDPRDWRHHGGVLRGVGGVDEPLSVRRSGPDGPHADEGQGGTGARVWSHPGAVADDSK